MPIGITTFNPGVIDAIPRPDLGTLAPDRDKPSTEDATRPDHHGLWIEPDGALYDLHRPEVRGELRERQLAHERARRSPWELALFDRTAIGSPPPVRLWSPSLIARAFDVGEEERHPDLRIPRGLGRGYSIYQAVDVDTGPVVVVNYTASKALERLGLLGAPRFLMVRRTGSGRFLFSIWPERYWSKVDQVAGELEHPPSRVPGSAPRERELAPADLVKLEGERLVTASSEFGGLAEGFRRAWAEAWGSPVEKEGQVRADSDSLIDVVGGGLRQTGELAEDVGEGLLDFANKGLLLGAAALLVFAWSKGKG